ncbi:VgrG-related protein [Desulfoplanes sp.]
MSKPNFIPINPDLYRAPSSVSGNRHHHGQTSDTSFQERFEQIKSRMDLNMANVLFDTDPPTKTSGTDLFSQTLNLDVLATLSKLSGQRSLAQPSSLPQLNQSVPDHVQPTTPDPMPPSNDADVRVDRLAQKIVTRHGTPGPESAASPPRGMLSRHFESGEQCDAVGYDRHGGTSYGTYQISSRQGTMDQFIDFLRKEIPTWAERLEQAGPADTGSTQGAMPSTWQSIAGEEPDLFGELQHRFITKTHYLPALEKILERTGLGENLFSAPLQEVLFSTAVQHGPSGAGDIFTRALKNLDPGDSTRVTSRLVDQIYAIRKTQFSSSSSQVQSAVTNRLTQEALLARNLLDSMLG